MLNLPCGCNDVCTCGKSDEFAEITRKAMRNTIMAVLNGGDVKTAMETERAARLQEIMHNCGINIGGKK